MSTNSDELWRIIGLPGPMRVATYLTTDNAPVYRLIVDVMLDEQPRYLSGIPHHQLADLVRERLAAHLAGDEQTLAAAMEPETLNLDGRLNQLATWGVIHAWEDKVRSDEDFTRHRGRYQLSEDAARLHRAVRALGAATGSGIAATLAPPVIAAQMSGLRESITTDPQVAATAWGVITPTMQNMSEAAGAWQARLASALSGSPDAAKIETLNDTLTGYVSVWGAGIDIYSADISRDARAALAVPPSAMRHVALHIAGSDASDDVVGSVVAEITGVLDRVLLWFDGPSSQAITLRRQMRDTIVPMVRGKRALAAVGGHVSRRNELLNLAERLDLAADDDAAWQVWATFTGLFSARHLGIASPLPGYGGDGLSFWGADPVPVEARLRRHGPRSGTGRPARIYDRSAGKRAAREAAAEAAREEMLTMERLLELSGRPLSEWTDLNGNVAERLADFITVIDGAIAELRRAGNEPANAVTARTGDGLWELSAWLPAPGTPDAIVQLPEGRLVYTDLTIDVRRAGERLDHAAT